MEDPRTPPTPATTNNGDNEFNSEIRRAAAVAEIFRGVEEVRANAHLRELEYNDKANERQFILAREDRQSRDSFFSKANQRWWAIFFSGLVFSFGLLLFSCWLISSGDPTLSRYGWDIIKIFGAFIVGVVGGWGFKASRQN